MIKIDFAGRGDNENVVFVVTEGKNTDLLLFRYQEISGQCIFPA